MIKTNLNSYKPIKLSKPKDIGKGTICYLMVLPSLIVLLLISKSNVLMLNSIDSGSAFYTASVSNSYSSNASNESIENAMHIYGIDSPRNVERPSLNRNIEDRGLTYGFGLSGFKKVDIGPPAFVSWGVLGSTLAHELEVHCNQSFFLIWVAELLGFNASHEAEREAYSYEVNNYLRFGLDMNEKDQINVTREFFYPVSNTTNTYLAALSTFFKKNRPEEHQ